MIIRVFDISSTEEYKKKMLSQSGDILKIKYTKFNETFVDELLVGTYQSNDTILYALHVEKFSDLLIFFDLAQVATLVEFGIELIIEQEPEISTIKFEEFEFEGSMQESISYGGSKELIIALLKAVSNTLAARPKGRAAATISKDFVDDYWKWQLETISAKEIVNNTKYAFATTAQFYSLAKRYESSYNYSIKLDELSSQLIKIKKHGKVDSNVFINLINGYSDSSLTPEIISKLKDEFNVSCVDLWRYIRTFILTKNFRESKDCELKNSIATTIKLIDDFDSEFFTTPLSLMTEYTSNYGNNVVNIMNQKSAFSKMTNLQKINLGMGPEIELLNISEEDEKLFEDYLNNKD